MTTIPQIIIKAAQKLTEELKTTAEGMNTRDSLRELAKASYRLARLLGESLPLEQIAEVELLFTHLLEAAGIPAEIVTSSEQIAVYGLNLGIKHNGEFETLGSEIAMLILSTLAPTEYDKKRVQITCEGEDVWINL